MDFVDLRCLSSGWLEALAVAEVPKACCCGANKRERDLLEEKIFYQLARVGSQQRQDPGWRDSATGRQNHHGT